MSKNPFNIIGKETGITTSEGLSGDLNEQINQLIGSADIFLFMKGNPMQPMCGFSANVIGLLNHLEAEFKTFDILSDEAIRQGVKEFSNWPTYPQLYVKGKLIGGNDIIMELYENGELEDVLKA